MEKGFITVFAMIFMLIMLSACGKTTYEIDKEISVAFEGYDEYGQAIVNLDKEGLTHELKEITDLEDRYDVVEFETIIDELKVQATPNENLKNGDEIDLELLYDEENTINLELKLKDTKITVEELEPIKALSQEEIFAGMDLKFEGFSPFLSANALENSSSDVSGLFNYTIPEKRFMNDEELEIIAEPINDLMLSGYKADEKDFTYTIKVPTQQKYVENWDELNEEDKEYVIGEIEDTVTAKIDAEIKNGNNSILDKGKYVGTGMFIDDYDKANREEQYIFFIKEQEFDDYSNEKPNSVRFVYKNKVTFGEAAFLDKDYVNKTKDYFSVVGAENLIVDENGELVRNELNVQTYGKTNLDKETVKNEAIYKIKDMFSVDEIEIDS